MSARRSVLPGFHATLAYTIAYLVLIVLIPLASLNWQVFQLDWGYFWHIVSDPRAISAYKISFGCAFIAATINCFAGFVIAWVFTRYRFPGKALLDSLIDLPFALPTAVAGITLASLYSPQQIPGKWIAELFHIQVVLSPLGIILALVFVTLPFVVRTLQPLLEDLNPELENAAASLGASPWQSFYHVILPPLGKGILTGFSLAFARGIGEYGAVIFIAGNMPFISETLPFLISSLLDQYHYEGAMALAAAMLVLSASLFLLINFLQHSTITWRNARHAKT